MCTSGIRGTARPPARMWLAMLVAAAALPGAAALANINAVAFSPGVFNTNTAAMDAALGITGYTIETLATSRSPRACRTNSPAPARWAPRACCPP